MGEGSTFAARFETQPDSDIPITQLETDRQLQVIEKIHPIEECEALVQDLVTEKLIKNSDEAEGGMREVVMVEKMVGIFESLDEAKLLQEEKTAKEPDEENNFVSLDEARWSEEIVVIEDEGEALGSLSEGEKVENVLHRSKEKDFYSDPERNEQQRKSLNTSKQRLGKMLRKFKPKVVALAEHFQMEEVMRKLVRDFHFADGISNSAEGGKLWLLWTQGIGCQVIAKSNQHITVVIEDNNRSMTLSVVYAKCLRQKRRQLWQEIGDIPSPADNWVVAGDFNIIQSDAERRGGRPRSAEAMEEFNHFINLGGLQEMTSMGGPFSWCNGHASLTRCWARLDRILMNNSCATNYPSTCMEYLSRSSSDHAPMVMWLDKPSTRYGPSPFRFQEMWTRHEDFFNCVKTVWEEEAMGTGLWKLACKLKKLRVALKQWNVNVFGWTHTHIDQLEKEIVDLDSRLQVEGSEEVDLALLAAKLELAEWTRREEVRLSQIAKQRWVEALSGFVTMDKKEISEQENSSLCALPSIQDIKETVFSIPVDSSPGPDGFTSGFYKSCWWLIEGDVVEAVWDFFRGSELPRFYSSSYLVLISKVSNPTSFEKFRPISLCSVIYKVCSKLLVRRLVPILSNKISQEQGAFIPGKSILENVSLTQELIQSLNKNVRGGNVMIKVDFAKAYDSINWEFLLQVLDAFGFSSQFQELVKQCVTKVWFSVVMNGTVKGYYKGGRGLRQGDPLSPILFILVEETFSRLLKEKFQNGMIGRFSHPRGAPLISHLLYADDMVIFANGVKKGVKTIMDCLEKYGAWSGQAVNKQQSAIYFSKHITRARRRSSLRTTGFGQGITNEFTGKGKSLGSTDAVGKLQTRPGQTNLDGKSRWKIFGEKCLGKDEKKDTSDSRF
ncbi:hypothetical protein F2P56_035204 [Juglans regia]|uniref:Reverse transcriptase domain-containing protein n=2 Tax=Juglans regia TaxID=51240 RepID=A0A833U1D8_JUGRE|nr:uncharacterized protein LOC108997250 [Juglans regia]KAF5442560.1 hypothetical protein F2P56_035204 [Juglans regia]